MMFRSALIISVVLFANVARSQAEMPLKPGDLVILECLSEKEGNRFLDGRTGDGTIGLAPKTGRGFTGTKWKVIKLEKGELGFECQGDVDGNRWLDGRTGDGTVGLAPRTGGVFTGTKWMLRDCGDGIVQLECLGDTKGPRWLDGVTGKATVQLTHDNKRSGTFWKVKKVG